MAGSRRAQAGDSAWRTRHGIVASCARRARGPDRPSILRLRACQTAVPARIEREVSRRRWLVSAARNSEGVMP
jgi:hypothetical protein